MRYRVQIAKWCKGEGFWSWFQFHLWLWLAPLLSSFSLNRFQVCYNARSGTFNPNIKLIPLSHLHHQISVKLRHFFSSERANLCDTQQGESKSLFIYLKMRKAEWCGAKSLNTTILFHGWYCPFPLFVPMKLIWSHG